MAALNVERMDEPRGLRLEGELDLATVGEVEAALQELVRQGGDITLDVRELRFMDSSAVQLLIRTSQGLDDRGRVVLDHPAHSVRRLIAVMGLDRIPNLEVHE
ncbi:MAG TPA: STAS domain-containing protein [Actinomycetota bacterium]|nr:STAS domain-containing protein [Actinomycetota bacterium]